jgi:hypothetical protein
MNANGEFGQILREAREQRHLTTGELADATSIPVRDIEALEAGLVDVLPRAMYRRAEARAYAEAVGLDPEVILAKLRGHEARRVECGSVGSCPPADTITRERRAGGSTNGPHPSGADDARAVRRPRHPYVSPVPPVHAITAASNTTARAGRAVLVLVIGCAALVWEQAGAPSMNMPVAPAIAVPMIDPSTIIDEAVRIAEPPPAPPSLRRALYEPRTAAPGNLWPGDGRLDEGVLIVHSTPRGARVTVNGVGWGVTPVAIRYLPLGTLRVRVGKAEHVMQERVVELTAEEPTNTLRVTLPALARRRAATPPAVRGDMLVITTEPAGARVTVNGIGWGTTPVSIAYLPSGAQRVRVVKEQFKSEERILDVREGQAGRVSFTLKPLS